MRGKITDRASNVSMDKYRMREAAFVILRDKRKVTVVYLYKYRHVGVHDKFASTR